VCLIEVGDFTGIALRRAAHAEMRKVVFVGMAGKLAKLAKLAAGVMMTHFHRPELELVLVNYEGSSALWRAGPEGAATVLETVVLENLLSARDTLRAWSIREGQRSNGRERSDAPETGPRRPGRRRRWPR
jgi:hypothetical protein